MFFFALVHERWVDDRGWSALLLAWKDMPWIVKVFGLTWLGRPRCKKMNELQGIGRLSNAERHARVFKDIDAVDFFLGNKEFLLGEKPSDVDCTVFAFLAGLCIPQLRLELGEYILKKPRIVTYLKRMQERYFPEYNGIYFTRVNN